MFNMSVKCTAIIMGRKRKPSVEETSNFENIGALYQKHYTEQQLCDLTFVVEGTELKAHKVLVAASMGFFKKKYTGPKEDRIPMEDVINITGVSAKTFKHCLDFVYFGEMRNEDVENLGNILTACRYLEVDRMKKVCYFRYKQWMTVKNAINIYQVLKFHKENTTQDEKLTCGEEFIIENAEKILTEQKSLQLMTFDTIEMILKCDEVSVHDENVLFKAVVKWVGLNEVERKPKFCHLFKLVRLPVINRTSFITEVNHNTHLEECKECKSYYETTMKYFLDSKLRTLQLYQLRPRARISIMSFYCSKLLTFNNGQLNQSSTPLPKMPIQSKCFAVNYHNGFFYVFGEDNGRRSYCLNVSLGMNNSKWVELPPMPTKRNDHRNFYSPQTLLYQDKILVIGGCVENKRINTVDCYNTETSSWEEFPALNVARSAFACAMLFWDIYVISGLEDGEESSTEIYRSHSDKWEIQPAPNTPRYGHSAMAFRSTLYIAGGRDRMNNLLSSVESITENRRLWTELTPMRYGRAFAAMFVNEGEVYVLGGHRDKKSSLWEKFNLKSKLWETSKDKDETVISEVKSFLVPYW